MGSSPYSCDNKNGFAATSAIPNEAFCHSEISVPRVETAPSPPSSANSSTFNLLLPSSSPSVSVQNLSVQSVSSVDQPPEVITSVSFNPLSETISSVSLSLPLNVEGEVTLPLLYDPLEGLFVNSDLTSLEVDNVQGLDTSSCSKCTPHEALEVIENALSS